MGEKDAALRSPSGFLIKVKNIKGVWPSFGQDRLPQHLRKKKEGKRIPNQEELADFGPVSNAGAPANNLYGTANPQPRHLPGQDYPRGNASMPPGMHPGMNMLGKDEVVDELRMGIVPVNNGINGERIPRMPNSITSEELRQNIKLTFTGKILYPNKGQYSERCQSNIGSISELPKWMHQYVTVPMKRSEVSKFNEVDFIKV